jgi:hypothetical protein
VAKSAVQLAKVCFSTPLLRPLFLRMIRNSDDRKDITVDTNLINELQEFIDKHVTSAHPEYHKACELLSKYAKTKKAEHLLRLYSLESPFYRQLGIGDKSKCLLILLLFRLNSLKARAFHGRTYRGLSLTTTDFRAYRWALRKKGSIISMRSFCSTSVDEIVARRFMSTSCSEKLSVLMSFDFLQPCDTAIQLYASSDKLPCISDFEDEHEVLLLPNTIFHVVSIRNEELSGQYTIHLENVLPKMDLMSIWSAGQDGSLDDVKIF